jgi:hypothetical protein
MFGEGVSFLDLTTLFKAIREKNLTLHVKVANDEWEELSGAVVTKMIRAINAGTIVDSSDIRLRLFCKDKQII